MASGKEFFINNPVFVKYKKRFDLFSFRSKEFLKSIHINERIIEVPFAIHALASLPRAAKILDLGCTESTVPLQLAGLGYQVTGFDFRPYPYTHPNFKFIQGDMTQLPFPEQQFDAVLSISTLEHVGLGFYTDPKEEENADRKAVAEIVRILKPNGIFILTAPYGVGAATKQQRVYDHKRLSEILSAFKIEEARYFHSSSVDKSAVNTWAEIKQEEADIITSSDQTRCVCCLKARPRM